MQQIRLQSLSRIKYSANVLNVVHIIRYLHAEGIFCIQKFGDNEYFHFIQSLPSKLNNMIKKDNRNKVNNGCVKRMNLVTILYSKKEREKCFV
jgi:hypothetical protein